MAPKELHVHNCDFMDNGAQYGGAVYIGSGTVTLSQSSLVGNIARRCGGALYMVSVRRRRKKVVRWETKKCEK